VDWLTQCAAVIPCLNEVATIESLVREIQRHLPQVIVVDDGSVDGTAAAAAKAGAEVIRHPGNQGKGMALASGLRRAAERGLTWALTMDGDGQHAPADIPNFLIAATQRRAALVVGNRLAQPHGMPRARLLVNRWMSRKLSRRSGQPLPDSQCGFRLVQLRAWSQLPLETAHFEVESEMLLAFVTAGLPVAFVPIQVIYKSRQSKIHPLIDTWRWFRWWWRRPTKPLAASRRRPIPDWPGLAGVQQDTGAEVE
jgi:glycosyltransferase involved in cell wall biosynthesis